MLSAYMAGAGNKFFRSMEEEELVFEKWVTFQQDEKSGSPAVGWMQQRCSEKEEGIRFKGTELARKANKQAGVWSPTAGCASSRVRPYSHWRFVSSVSRAEVMVPVMGKMYKWSRQGLEEGDVIWLQKEDLEFWVESDVTTGWGLEFWTGMWQEKEKGAGQQRVWGWAASPG